MSDSLVFDPNGGMPRLLEIMARLRDHAVLEPITPSRGLEAVA